MNLRSSLVAVSAALVAFVLLPTSSAVHLREDPNDEQVVTGYLSSVGSAKAIGWSEATASDDFAGPATVSLADQAKLFVGGLLGQQTGGGRNMFISPANDEVFPSAPLPRTVFLNVTRHLQVDLFIKPSRRDTGSPFSVSPPQWNVQLFLLSPTPRFLGGATLDGTQGAGDIWYPPGSAEHPVPIGFTLLSYRFHPELDVLPAGTKVELRINHVQETGSFQIGLKAEYRSVIRFAPYPNEELPFRLPAHVLGGSGSGPTGAQSAQGLSFLATLVPARARGRRAAALASLLAIAGLSGCAQVMRDSEPSAVPSGDSYLIRDDANRTGLVDQTTGTLAGTVSDERSVPVEGVRVSVVDESSLIGVQTQTDPWGHFTTSQLSPSDYRVTLQKEGFERWQNTVHVVSASITVLNATMRSLAESTDDSRQHRHDDWGTEVEKVVMNEPGLNFLAADYMGQVAIPEGRKILPGTREVQVRLHWDAAATGVAHIGLRVFTNAFPATGGKNLDGLFPRGPDEWFHFPTTWDHNDKGHQNFTTWRIELWRPMAPEHGTLTDNTYPDFLPVDVEVRIMKGLVPLENPHPNRWGADVARYIVKDAAPDHNGICNAGFEATRQADPTSNSFCKFGWFADEVVPVGTTWMEAQLKVATTSGPTPETDWRFGYKGGDTSASDCDLYGSATARRTDVAAHSHDAVLHTYSFRFALKATDPDAIYAERSAWCFASVPDDATAVALSRHSNGDTLGTMQLQMTVIAHRDPMPT